MQQAHNTDDGADAIFLASGYGLIPDPWQCEIVNGWLGRRRDGKWQHSRGGLAVPRQNGKNGAVEVREIFGLIELGEAILHTAHQIKTSRKAFKRLKHFFGEKENDPEAKFPELNALVAEVRNTNGQEAIVLKDLWSVDGQIVRSKGRPVVPGASDIQPYARGGFVEFATRAGGRGGRGTTYDLLIIDEAQHLSDEDLEAIRPTVSSGALGNSQVIWLGTPPNPEKLTEKIGAAWVRLRAGAGHAKDLAWVEYGVPDGPLPDLEDITLLYAANPSLEILHGNGSHGLSLETVIGERGDLTPEGYARERLGWWGNPEAKSHRGVIDMQHWATLKVSSDRLPARGLIVVDAHPKLKATTVALITDGPQDKPLAMVDRHPGTKWTPARIQQLHQDLATTLEIALTPSAWIFATDLDRAEIPYKKLSRAEVAAGCSGFQKLVTDARVTHLGQSDLDKAIRHAVPRMHGDTQQWDRGDLDSEQTIDIGPLVAVSVGTTRWTALTAKPDKPPPVPRRHRTPPATAGAGPRPSRADRFDPRSSGF